ncbi:MAG: RNA polymerase sigma factor [Candidatus Baltobacteraceae bacterium]
MDEASLAQAFARREPWAFDEAFRRYGSLLFSVALNVLHSPEDAEDCVHDVAVRVWKRPGAFVLERGSVRAFLAVCVRNEAVSRARTASRRGALLKRLDASPEPAEEFDIPDHLEQARVRDALAALPPEQRDALTLAYFGGKTHAEVASVLGEPLGTVKSRIALGLRKMAAALSAQETL